MLYHNGVTICTIHNAIDINIIYYFILEKHMQLSIILPTNAVHNVEVFKDASVAELMIQLNVRIPYHAHEIKYEIPDTWFGWTN